MSDLQRRQFHEALLDADTFEHLTGKWQAAILKGRANGPDMRVVGTGWLADLHVHSLAPTSHVGADASPEPLGPVRSGNPRELSVKDGESLERLCITNPPIRRDI